MRPDDPRGLRGRTALVTGAAGGIGRALCRRLAAEGCRLGLLDADGAGAEAAAAELRAGGATAVAAACDVTDAAAARAAVEGLARALGGVDLLVNNAGITHRSPFAATDVDVLRRVMEVNFFGAVHCTQAALPHLVARRGRIVVVSSVAGFAPLVGRTGYAASKHALHGLFDTLRAELAAQGVEVLIVCPSFTATGIERAALGGRGGRPASPKATVGRPLAPDEVAAAIVGGLARGERLLVLSPVGKAAYWLTRLAPRAYAWLMTRAQRAELTPA